PAASPAAPGPGTMDGSDALRNPVSGFETGILLNKASIRNPVSKAETGFHPCEGRPMTRTVIAAAGAWCVLLAGPAVAADPPRPDRPAYETREKHDPNGIGKFYLDREIAQVMGYQG